jgi:hypothetical protein
MAGCSVLVFEPPDSATRRLKMKTGGLGGGGRCLCQMSCMTSSLNCSNALG